MHHRFLTVLVLIFTNFIFTNTSAQTCFSGGVLATQEDVEAFGAMNCEHLEGSLHIIGTVTDLSPLHNLKTITGYLWIAGTALENLNGLDNLDSIGDYLRLYYNDSLVSLQGLDKLRKVNSYIRIESNNKLESIAALDKLESAFTLLVNDNPALEHVGAFSGLRHLRTDLTIEDGRISTISGFTNLKKVRKMILSSDSLRFVSGFNNLDSATSIHFRYLPNLESVQGFTSLTDVSEQLQFSICPRLTTIPAFNQLTTVSELSVQLEILTTLPDFSSLEKADIIDIGGPLMEHSPAFPSLRSAGEISINGYAFLSYPAFPVLDTVQSIRFENSQWVESLPNYDQINYIEKINITSLTRLRALDMFNDMPHLKEVVILINDSLQSLRIGNEVRHMKLIAVSSNTSLTSFEGFENLETADQIGFLYNIILPALPSFPNLTAVRNSLTIIYTGIGALNGFNQLDSIGNHFISPTCGLYLEDLHNLTSITGFDSLVHVHDFRMLLNTKLDSIEGFRKLSHITGDCSIDITALRSLDFLRTVRKIDGGINLRQNTQLTDIDGLDSIDLFAVNEITITDNPELAACNTHWICSAIELNRPHLFKNNDTPCNSEFDVRQSCDGIYSHIYTEVYYDLNQNGVRDAGEPLFPTSRIIILPDTVEVYVRQDAGVTQYIPFGDYRVSSFVLNPEKWMLTSSPDTFTVSLTDTAPGDTLHFGYYPVELVSDVRTYQVTYDQVCNLGNKITSVAQNQGTTLEDGILWIRVDDHAFYIAFEDPDHIQGDFGGYNFEDLFPGENFTIPVKYTVPGPDTFTLGDSLYFEAYVEFTSPDDTSKHYHLASVVKCSFDPNDKLTNPSRLHDQTLLDEDLHYTIRFENTGNLEATNITIIDTLAAHLDINSVIVTASSHLNRLETSIRDNIITFHFRNIYLPYTSWPDSLAQQGYVSFTVKPIKPIAANTIIENRASIYFDLNPPILTNTARNWFVSVITSIEPTPASNFISSRIQPNPATKDAVLTINTTTQAARRILFFNSLGQQVHQLLSTDLEVELHGKDFEKGMHYYQVWENGRIISTGKFILL